MIHPTITELKRLAGDGVGMFTGFTMADPYNDPILGILHNTLLSVAPDSLLQIIPSQGAVDEIAKLLAGLFITVTSRFVFTAIQKWKEKNQERKTKTKIKHGKENSKAQDSANESSEAKSSAKENYQTKG